MNVSKTKRWIWGNIKSNQISPFKGFGEAVDLFPPKKLTKMTQSQISGLLLGIIGGSKDIS